MRLMSIVLLFSFWNVSYPYTRGRLRRVFAGEPDRYNEFPYVITLQMKKPPQYRLCTGSLLAPNWVLTAAHCVSDDTPKIIRYAEFTKKPTETEAYAKIYKTFIHPSYNEELLKNDLALLLIEKVTNPIGKLSAVDFRSLLGLPVKYAGFGLTDWDFVGTISDDNPILNVENMTKALQVGSGLIVPCESYDYGVICIAPTCNSMFQELRPGDYGAPLVQRGKIVAVSTRGYLEDLPILNFSPVSPNLPWIEHVINSVSE